MVTPASTEPVWRFGVFEVDTHRLELRRSGIPIKIREQSFQVLVSLLEHAGDIVTREELRHLLWPSDTFVDFDHSLNTAVMKLREALGDPIESPIYIETVPKRGYRFIAPVAVVDPSKGQAAITEPEVRPAQSGADTRQEFAKEGTVAGSRRRFGIPATLGVVLLAIGVGLVLMRGRCQLFSFKASEEAAPVYRIESVTTASGDSRDPAISPDGRDVAFAWNGGGGDHYDIYVQRIGSMMPIRLTYIKTGFVGSPAWSPDQTEIAFTRCDGINDGVYIVPAFGGPERKLTNTNCQYHLPTQVAWLPDSRMLMIDRCPESGRDALVLFLMDTGEKRCIADFGQRGELRRFHYSVSPDQKSVAFIPSDESPVCGIYTMPVSGGSPRRIVEDKSPCIDLMWTRDGKAIVFLSERTNFGSLWQVGAKGGQISNSTYPAIGMFSRDGRRLVYSEQLNGDPPGVWRADLARPGGKVLAKRKLISSQFWEADAQPSSDGAHLAWEQVRGNAANLWIGDLTGNNRRQLTHLDKAMGTPRWSPDDRWIVFDLYFSEATPQIYTVDVEGRNLRAITHGPYMNMVPSWSRDGKSIYFVSNRSGRNEVWKHSMDTGMELQLTKRGGFDPLESFDGETVYFTKFDEPGIWSIPSSGGEESLVIKGRPQVLYWGHWTLTRPGIYFADADAEPGARIEFYDFATKEISPVFSFEHNAVLMNPSVSATADGKTLFYLQWDRQSAIKLMEFSN